VVVLPVNLLTEATVITVAVPGRRRVALGLLDAKCQSVGARGTLLPAVGAPPPPPGDGHEPAHPAKHRRPAAAKLVEGEPPQPSIEASPPRDDYGD
jgi:hypothetical protein